MRNSRNKFELGTQKCIRLKRKSLITVYFQVHHSVLPVVKGLTLDDE